jgi:hypothetical protein
MQQRQISIGDLDPEVRQQVAVTLRRVMTQAQPPATLAAYVSRQTARRNPNAITNI